MVPHIQADRLGQVVLFYADSIIKMRLREFSKWSTWEKVAVEQIDRSRNEIRYEPVSYQEFWAQLCIG